jgi:hypothetical protein
MAGCVHHDAIFFVDSQKVPMAPKGIFQALGQGSELCAV